MGSALVYVVVVGVVAAAVYLLAALVFGRGEELAPMAPGATPTRLPASGLTGDDVRELRFQQTVRGYKCSEVDWALERLAAEVDALRERLDVVTAAEGPGGPAEPVEPSSARPARTFDADDPAPTDPTPRAHPAAPGSPAPDHPPGEADAGSWGMISEDTGRR